MKVIITVGVSASGKSTFATNFINEQWDKQRTPFWAIVCRDDIRAEIVAEKSAHDEFTWAAWNFKWEKEVSKRQWEKISRCFNDSQIAGIIIADTNLSYQRLQTLQSDLRDLGVTDIEVKEFPITFEEAIKRDNARKNGVGYSVIAEQMIKWRKYQQEKDPTVQWEPNEKLPKAIMVDLDGTLGHMNGKRGPFDWAKVGNDDLDIMVAEVLHGLSTRGFSIIVMSGRDSICRKETEQWLFDHGLPISQLHMRAQGDMRKDSIVKKELFLQHVAPYFNVMGVFDDRPQVVRCWIELGLKTFALGNQLIEF